MMDRVLMKRAAACVVATRQLHQKEHHGIIVARGLVRGMPIAGLKEDDLASH